MTLQATQLLQTPSVHAKSLIHAADTAWSMTNEAIARVGDTLALSLFKPNLIRILQNIRIGTLSIVENDTEHKFGSNSAQGDGGAVITVKSKKFWTRVALFTDIGFAESYMYGEVDCDDISAVLKILIKNRPYISEIDTWTSSILSLTRKLTYYKFLGTDLNARANISSHYDLGNFLFQQFLSEDMNYSSAIFLDYEGDIKPGVETVEETLEDAQLRKMRMLVEKLNIQPGERVLEIGTGFGSLSILAAQTVNCSIETITLSINQCNLARERIKAAGLEDRITVHNIDFRECLSRPEWHGAFDKFISIEMIENVGKDFIEEYWRVVDWALKPSTGVGVVQVISMPEARTASYDSSGADFIQKWIFPGAYMPSLLFLLETMFKGSNGRLTADSVINIGPHYARTLRSWKRKFLSNWDVIKNALIEQYKLDAADIEIFKRKWIYYFDYCESGFATRTLGDHVIKFTREGHVGFGCDYRSTI